MSISDYSIPASALHKAVRRHGVNAVTTVPDLVQLAFHNALKSDPEVLYLDCSTENQALTTAAGLYIGGKVPLVMMQNQGLFNCINTLRSLCLDAHIPMVLSVGQFGRENSNLGHSSRESSRVCVNRVEPVLDALDIPYFLLDREEHLGRIDEAFEQAVTRRTASVLLIGHYPSWS